MPSVYQLKSRFQSILRPVVGKLAENHITANQVTVFALLISAAQSLWMVMGRDSNYPWLFLPFLLFIRMALNAIDGMLAREHNMKSKLGAILNELADVISDTLLYLPFALIAGIYSWAAVIICLLAIISEMTGVIGVQIGGTRRYDGPMGKSDRAAVFGLSGFLFGAGIINISWLNNIFFVMILLLIATIYNRASHSLKETKM